MTRLRAAARLVWGWFPTAWLVAAVVYLMLRGDGYLGAAYAVLAIHDVYAEPHGRRINLCFEALGALSGRGWTQAQVEYLEAALGCAWANGREAGAREAAAGRAAT